MGPDEQSGPIQSSSLDLGKGLPPAAPYPFLKAALATGDIT
jgi:hypothetical protein